MKFNKRWAKQGVVYVIILSLVYLIFGNYEHAFGLILIIAPLSYVLGGFIGGLFSAESLDEKDFDQALNESNQTDLNSGESSKFYHDNTKGQDDAKYASSINVTSSSSVSSNKVDISKFQDAFIGLLYKMNIVWGTNAAILFLMLGLGKGFSGDPANGFGIIILIAPLMFVTFSLVGFLQLERFRKCGSASKMFWITLGIILGVSVISQNYIYNWLYEIDSTISYDNSKSSFQAVSGIEIITNTVAALVIYTGSVIAISFMNNKLSRFIERNFHSTNAAFIDSIVRDIISPSDPTQNANAYSYAYPLPSENINHISAPPTHTQNISREIKRPSTQDELTENQNLSPPVLDNVKDFNHRNLLSIESHIGAQLFEQNGNFYFTEDRNSAVCLFFSTTFNNLSSESYWVMVEETARAYLKTFEKGFFVLACRPENDLLILTKEEFESYLPLFIMKDHESTKAWGVKIQFSDQGVAIVSRGTRFPINHLILKQNNSQQGSCAS
ncbi:MAG: hypothetical protein AAF984_09720 [Verrucomicrobiota bacterium]